MAERLIVNEDPPDEEDRYASAPIDTGICCTTATTRMKRVSAEIPQAQGTSNVLPG